MTSTSNTHRSSYREILIEHLFVGEVMRLLWLRGITRFEVLKPQVDDSGYDLVLEANGVVRHVQLKSSFRSASTAQVKVSLLLESKPSACVVWIYFDAHTMKLGPYRWYGGAPRQPIPSIAGLRVAKHTRANAQGMKKERPEQRIIPKGSFEVVATLEEMVSKLFGEFGTDTAARSAAEVAPGPTIG